MRCAICNRPLLHPKVTLGAMNLGPKCAVRAGFIEAPRPREAPLFSRLPVKRDKRTADMFAEAA
jgi:hypothetical protein